MKKIIIALLAVVIATTACKKDNAENEICTIAEIKYGGDPAADGLGWYLSVSDESGTRNEYPENLDGAFKTNGLLADVCYVKTDNDFVCFCLPPRPKMVRIVSIKKR
jgi:hypothetical protein